jgi:hypothetical protein
MKWVIDSTGRFDWRPYYDQDELDNECEQLVSNFLRAKNGTCRFPISTDDLSIMLEQETSDLDLYADLSREGDDVEGMTDFFPHKKAAVKIAQELSLDGARYTRLRTTLAHEYGHVRFHSFLWDFNRAKRPVLKITRKLALMRRRYNQLRPAFAPGPGNSCLPQFSTDKGVPTLFSSDKSGSCFRCKGSRILDAPVSDWMEWQAGYICGAVLMPHSLVWDLVRKSLPEQDGHHWCSYDTEKARELITRAAEKFDVSAEAARVRLLKLGFLQTVC